MLRRLPATALIGLALASTLVACGSSDGEIPTGNAAQLDQMLNDLQAQVDSGDCTGAEATLNAIRDRAEQLPSKVSSDTRQGLQQLIDNLDLQVSTHCAEEETTTTSSTTSTTSEPSTTTSTTETSTTETSTSTTDDTSTDTTTTTNTDEPPPPPDGGGGGAGGGGSGGTGPGSGGTAPRGDNREREDE